MTDTGKLEGIENALYGIGSAAGTLKIKMDSLYTGLETISYELDELHCMVIAVRESISKQIIAAGKDE